MPDHLNSAGSRKWAERTTSLRGVAWKRLLRFAEQLAYDVAQTRNKKLAIKRYVAA